MSRAIAMRHMNGRSLAVLAKDIENRHQAAHQAAGIAIDHALRCGELLLKAKSKVTHGKWLPWLAANTTIGPRQAQNFMRLARNKAEIEARKCATDSHICVREAVALLAAPKPEREMLAKRIKDRWTEAANVRREFVRCLGEARETFEDDATYKTWLVKNEPVGSVFADKIPDLLSRPYDEDAWIDAMLADILAGLEEGSLLPDKAEGA